MPSVQQIAQHLVNEINLALDDLPGNDRRKAQTRIFAALKPLVDAAEKVEPQPVQAERFE